ncbi:hypothetical protein B0H14DRAFT_2668644 [Mycena olivaceomarginata]|nr:hypothetical protein B0H14DRAFT_2668644 [Mycena olivaceomarginata]
MRKTSYAITALAVICTTVFTILSLTRTDWVVARYDVNALSYEGQIRSLEGMPTSGARSPRGRHLGSKEPTAASSLPGIKTTAMRTAISVRHGQVPVMRLNWQLASVLYHWLAILVGVSTAARRRRVWRAVAGFIIFHSVAQLVAFILIVDLYRTARYPTFEDAKLGPALIFNAVAWIFGVITAVTVIITGTEADRGKRWAAGNRPVHTRLDEATSLLRGN